MSRGRRALLIGAGLLVAAYWVLVVLGAVNGSLDRTSLAVALVFTGGYLGLLARPDTAAGRAVLGAGVLLVAGSGVILSTSHEMPKQIVGWIFIAVATMGLVYIMRPRARQ
jgi:hypothetical protein